MFPTRNRAFTLIELLIVVAIIAILAAIAVPNFLEAQVRSKVSRVSSDQRTLATALETYYVDNNKYPPAVAPGGDPIDNFDPDSSISLTWLTTPIAYVTSLSSTLDPFQTGATQGNAALPSLALDVKNFYYVSYDTFPPQYGPDYKFKGWGLSSLGPDHDDNGVLWLAYYESDPTLPRAETLVGNGVVTIYDPTNGTISSGDIARYGGEVGPVTLSLAQ